MKYLKTNKNMKISRLRPRILTPEETELMKKREGKKLKIPTDVFREIEDDMVTRTSGY